MRQTIKYLNYLNLFSALYIIATSIYYFQIQRIAFYVFFIGYFIEFILEKKWEKIQFDNKMKYFLVIIFFYLIGAISILFDDSQKYYLEFLGERASLIGFSFVGIFGFNKKFKTRYLYNTIILSSLFAIGYLIFVKIGFFEFLKNPERNRVFCESRLLYVNDHMMFNLYLNIALLFIWHILSTFFAKLSKWLIILYVISFAIILYSISISEGRCGVIECSLLLPTIAIIEVWKRNRKIAIGIMLIAPVLLFGILSQHKRINKPMLESEPRLFLWKSAISVIKESPFYGHGMSGAQEKFDAARIKFQTEEFRIWTKRFRYINSHNQYLQTTMEAGLFGLLVLLIIYLAPILLANKERQLLMLLFIALCLYQSVFDVFITAQKSSLFCLVIIFLLIKDDKKSQQSKSIED